MQLAHASKAVGIELFQLSAHKINGSVFHDKKKLTKT
jgi:hypothetical protein